MPDIQPEADLAHGVAADLDPATRDRIEAAAFRKLVAHLRDGTAAQNIELMNLAGFCRNCLSRWWGEAATDAGLAPVDPQAAREVIYGMPYREWQALHQTPATPEQQAAFAAGSH